MDSYTLSLNMHERTIITHIHILTILPYINTSMTKLVGGIYVTFNVDNSQYNKYFDIPVFHRVYGY
jgi:hypothetical protein